MSYDSTILADGPVLFMPSSSDASGHGHTVGVHGTPVVTTMPNGDSALAYDGVDDYLEVANSGVTVMSDAFAYTSGATITSESYYDYAAFPGAGSSDPSNPSSKWEMDTGTFKADSGWGWSNTPLSYGDREFFRLNTQQTALEAVVDWDYKSAAYGVGGYGPPSSSEAVDVWLRYRSQYNLYVLQFDRYDNKIYLKRKVPAQGWGGNAGSIANKGVYYVIPVDSANPLGTGGAGGSSGLYNTWAALGLGNLAHDGAAGATGTSYHFKATISTIAPDTVQVKLYRNGTLVGSWTDTSQGIDEDTGRTLTQDLAAGYFNSVSGWQASWGKPIQVAGKSGFRADNIQLWIDNFVMSDGVGGDLSVSAAGGGTAITIEAWIRPDILQFPHDESSGYVHWAGKGYTGAHEWACRMYSQITSETPSRPNRISGYCFNASGGLGVGSYFQDLITAGAWLHYVLVISAIPAAGNDPNGWPLDHGSTSVWKNSVLRDQDGLNQAGSGGLGLMVPTPGPAPVRVGTRDLGSFFKGAIGKFAVYPYALSGAQILAHYNAMLPFPSGSSVYIGALPGLDTGAGAGATSVMTLASTVPVGDTIIARVAQSYTDGGGTITDSKGNTWVRDDSGKDDSQTMRVSTFSCQVGTALVPSDTVTLTWGSTPSLPVVRMIGLDQFRRVVVMDTHNEAAYASTIKPGGNIPITPTAGNDLVIGSVLLAGDTSVSFAQPPGYTALPRVGSAGRPFTLGGGWKTVGTYVNVLTLPGGPVRLHNPRPQSTYEPVFGSAQSAVELLTAYKGV